MSWTSLCELPELTEGQGKYVEIGGFQLAVFLSRGQVRVIDNECPHAGGDLVHGWIEAGCVVCPLHCWPFNLETGQLRDAPGVTIRVYPVRILERPEKPTLVQADLPIY
jgi:nitrite reductase/ring-hydroxylating ferredoxin subunit